MDSQTPAPPTNNEGREILNGMTPWEKAIQLEAENFVKAMQQNFLYGLKITRKALPKIGQNELLAQLNIFVDALTAFHVQTIVNFINPSEEIEETVYRAMREKFAEVRRMMAVQAEKAKLGLVDTKGKPLS